MKIHFGHTPKIGGGYIPLRTKDFNILLIYSLVRVVKALTIAAGGNCEPRVLKTFEVPVAHSLVWSSGEQERRAVDVACVHPAHAVSARLEKQKNYYRLKWDHSIYLIKL